MCSLYSLFAVTFSVTVRMANESPQEINCTKHHGDTCQYCLLFRCVVYKETNEMENKDDLPKGRVTT